jgi:hypothetical protein
VPPLSEDAPTVPPVADAFVVALLLLPPELSASVDAMLRGAPFVWPLPLSVELLVVLDPDVLVELLEDEELLAGPAVIEPELLDVPNEPGVPGALSDKPE